MPLLGKESDLYPLELFELLPESEPWVVTHVRSWQEKVLARYLLERRIPFFLPQVTRTLRTGERRRTSHLPLFPGYVFWRGGRDRRTECLRSGVVVSFIEPPDQTELHEELAQLHRLQLSGASLVPYDHFQAGDPVRVCEGAFQGYSGVVVREKGKERLVVRVAMIASAVAVEFPREMVTRIR
ncbi:MAG: transcription termination/antitermination NusG family protein [Acidobacteriota bacterium]